MLCANSAANAQAPPAPGKGDTTARRANPGNLVGHGGPVKAIAISPDGRAALTGSFDYAAMQWAIDTPSAPVISKRFGDNGGAVNAVAFVKWGFGPVAWVWAGDDGTVARAKHAIDGGSGGIQRFNGHSAKIVGLAVASNGELAATASWDRTARVWHVGPDRQGPGPVLEGHLGPVNAVAFSSDGSRVFTAGADGHIRAFDSKTGTLERSIYKHGWGINVLAGIPGTGHLVFGALNGTVAIVDGGGGDLVRELPSHDRPVLALAVHEKTGLIATGGGDGVVRVLRAPDGSVVEEHRNAFGPVWALAFTGAGDGLYYGGLDDFATLWRFTPREAFEPVDSSYPRRFQVRPAAGRDATEVERVLAAGELQFARKCSVCHTLTPDGANRAGPTLHGIFGRRIATLPDYPYSAPLKMLDIVWNEATVAKLFELGPEVFTPGSKMPLQTMTDQRERDALIAFLKVATVDAAGANGRESGKVPGANDKLGR